MGQSNIEMPVSALLPFWWLVVPPHNLHTDHQYYLPDPLQTQTTACEAYIVKVTQVESKKPHTDVVYRTLIFYIAGCIYLEVALLPSVVVKYPFFLLLAIPLYPFLLTSSRSMGKSRTKKSHTKGNEIEIVLEIP
jgi:hypothetical protein